MFRRVAPTARALAVVIGGGLLATCQRDAAGPGGRAALAVGVQFPASTDLAAFNLIVDHTRLIVVDPPSQVVFDQTFAFQANDSSIQVTADVPLDQSPQTFTVTIQLLSGGVVLFEGTQDVTVYSGSSNSTAEIPVLYAGPGQNVAALTLGPADSVLSFGAALTFRVTAQDGQGAPVSNFYVSWSTDNAAVAIDATGRLSAPNQRTSVVVTARTPITASQPNGVAASTPITFVPVPTTLSVSGCDQSAPPATQLPQPIVAQVTASDGQGVRGVVVTFTAPAGAAVATPQVVTDANGIAQTLATLGATGPAVFQVSAPGLTTVQCTQSVVGAVSQLAFTTQPSSTAAGNAITPAVVVAAQDAQGTLVPTYAGDVTIALGANPGGAILSGTKTVTAVGGLATFTNLSLDQAGTGYTLQASAASLSPVTSAAFDVTAAAANQLAFTVQPAPTSSGSPITPPVQVIAQDAFGNRVTSFAGSVTVSIDSGPAGAQLTGTTVVTAVAGVASLSNLSLDKVGCYHLRVHATGLTDAISGLFCVTVGSTRQLVFTVQPGATTAGSAIVPAVAVTAQDLQGNTDATFTGLVTVAIQLNAGGGTLSGTTSSNAVAGVATFAGLSIDRSGAGYTLQATASGITTGVSAPFTVNAAPPSLLAFVVPPTTVPVGAKITPAVVVAVHDAFGNLVDTATDVVTVAMNVNPGNATLGGTTSRAAVAGLATFDDLTLDQAGTGYSFVANAPGLSTGISPTFDVTAGAASHFVVILSPAQITAGQTVDITVEARDAGGNIDPSYTGTVQFTSGDLQATLPPDYTFTAGDNGTHMFPAGATLYLAPATTVGASDGSISGFGVATVLPAAESQLVYLFQPSTVAQNVAMTPTVEVAVEDAFGNIVTTTQTQVALRIGTNPANGILSGGGPVTPINGVAMFSSVSIDQPGTGYTLIASAGTLPNLTSDPFDVLPTGAVNTWFGEVGTDWNNALNWSNGVPVPTDNVYIPAAFNLPELTSNVTVNDVTVDPGANIETNGFRLTATGTVDVGAQISDTSSAGTGTVELAGAGRTATGYLPNVVVTGTVSVTNYVYAIGNMDIQGSGNVTLNGSSVYVSGNFSTSGSGTIDINSSGFLEVVGNATFGGGSETGRLKSGTLWLSGNFSQTGSAASFDADYGLYVAFVGSGNQTVSFANPGASIGTSHFGLLEVYNYGGTFSLLSSAFTVGELYVVGGSGTVIQLNGNGNTLTAKGLLVDSVTIDNMPLVVDSSDVVGIYQFDNVTFQNFASTAVQFSLTRSTGTYTFNNLTFATVPNTSGGGLYMRLNDPVAGNGRFTVSMVGASPSGQGTTQNVQVLGEASLVW